MTGGCDQTSVAQNMQTSAWQACTRRFSAAAHRMRKTLSARYMGYVDRIFHKYRAKRGVRTAEMGFGAYFKKMAALSLYVGTMKCSFRYFCAQKDCAKTMKYPSGIPLCTRNMCNNR